MSEKLLSILFFLILIVACSPVVEDVSEQEEKIIEIKEVAPELIKEVAPVKVFVKTVKEPPLNYPGIVKSLKNDEFEKVKLKVEKLASRNCEYTKKIVDGKEILYTPVSSKINSFGYIEEVRCDNPVKKSKSGKAVEVAVKELLNEYENFLGIVGKDLVIDRTLQAGDSSAAVLKAQVYKELPVLVLKNNQVSAPVISAFITESDLLKQIKGHFYDVNIPVEPVLTVEQASDNLFGEDISYADLSGDIKKRVIGNKDLSYEGSLVVLVVNSEDKLEHRLAWRIPVKNHLWEGFVDAMTGEVLVITQEFVS